MEVNSGNRFFILRVKRRICTNQIPAIPAPKLGPKSFFIPRLLPLLALSGKDWNQSIEPFTASLRI